MMDNSMSSGCTECHVLNVHLHMGESRFEIPNATFNTRTH